MLSAESLDWLLDEFDWIDESDGEGDVLGFCVGDVGGWREWGDGDGKGVTLVTDTAPSTPTPPRFSRPLVHYYLQDDKCESMRILWGVGISDQNFSSDFVPKIFRQVEPK